MEAINNRKIVKWGFLGLWIITTLGFLDYLALIQANGWLQISRKMQFSQIAGWVFLALFGVFVVYLHFNSDFAEKARQALSDFLHTAVKFRWLAVLFGALLLPAYPLLILGRTSIYLDSTWTRLAVFAWISFAHALLFTIWRQKDFLLSLAFSGTFLAAIYHFATYLPHISNFPFGLWWSEVSRFYLASTFFDTRIYGVDTPWVFRDTTRYLMQAVPFIVPGLPLWVHRLWQVLLRFFSSYLTGWVFARRLNLPKRAVTTFIFVLWSGLYLFQGPVFYNLLVIVILSLWLLKPSRYWRTLLAVAGITVWAGLSRINWVPMPALIAIMFYLLEEPYEEKGWNGFARYFWKPVSWGVVGIGVGLLTQSLYAHFSGNIQGVATTSFTSDLIWQRLFPNVSYPLGIILSVLLVTVPMMIFTTLSLRKAWPEGVDWLRALPVVGIIGVLFGGGLLVSVKIGGGTNLHNMDVFLVALWIVAVSLFYGKSSNSEGITFAYKPPRWVMTAIIAAPIIFVVLFGGRSIQAISDEVVQQDLETLSAYVYEAVENGGEVLFISQRHLITFGYLEGVPLVHEYEKMELMDNIMAGTPAYLEAFAEDMASQRFALIIQDPMPSIWKNPAKQSLSQENNVYLKRAVPLISCAYEEEIKLVNNSIQLMVPLDEPTCGLLED